MMWGHHNQDVTVHVSGRRDLMSLIILFVASATAAFITPSPSERLRLQELQKVCIDLVLEGAAQTVRSAGVDLQARIRRNLDRGV